MLKLMRVCGHRQAGLSLVELMIGMTIGLVVVAGATSLFIGNLGSSRRLLIEARVNQDLRAAADVIARDLRRAGYWENSIAGTVTTAAGMLATPNPNAAASATGTTVIYSVARDRAISPARCAATGPCTDNDRQADEQFGFMLDAGAIKMRLGVDASGDGIWQPMTDPGIVTINRFVITPTETPLNVANACAKLCTGASCPQLFVRSYGLLLQGTAVGDGGVTRVLQETVRIRNDHTTGSCPS
ncbi:MAG: PilW family protein [Roseateles sp.]|uniref:PilW family protein n=1 Tax=Roseateles sp. TaxID=1971397 RepID=UPI0040356BB6